MRVDDVTGKIWQALAGGERGGGCAGAAGARARVGGGAGRD